MRQGPPKHELVTLAVEVSARLLRDAVEEDLEAFAHACR
jgi:hypothetical protein